VRTHHPLRAALVFGAAGVFVRGAASASPVDVLRKALRGPAVPYEGVQETTVYSDAGSTVSQVFVQSNGKGAFRREFKTGPSAGVVVLQIGHTVWQTASDGAFRRLPSGGRQDPEEVARSIVGNYNVSVSRGKIILGRKTAAISITARYRYNPSRKLVIDEATGLILQDELFAPDGAKRSSTVFIRLSFKPQAATLFLQPAATGLAPGFGPASFEARDSEEAVLRETGRAPARPSQIPPGYRVVAFGVVTTGRGGKTAAVRFSDGLAAFTVFTRPGGPRVPGPRGWGGGGGQGRRGHGPGGPPWRVGELQVTETRQQAMVTCTSRRASYVLIGDLSADELQRIARSLP